MLTLLKFLGLAKQPLSECRKKFAIKLQGIQTKGSLGGRRRGHLSFEQEKEFLVPWIETAERGGVLVVPPIHAAYEDELAAV